jgi:hypothetical protein
MKRLVILFTLCFTVMAGQTLAQEICNNNLDDDGDGLVDCRDGDCGAKVCEICDNGIDDDGDRFIDCYDKECTIDPDCDGFFLGTIDSCSVIPTTFPPFEMKLKYKSEPNRTNHINRLIVGDVDSDGVPELVTTYRRANDDGSNTTQSVVNILQAPAAGTTLTLDEQFDLLPAGIRVTFEDIAMADINKDGCAEIFVLSTEGGYKIHSFDCNGNSLWAAPISFSFYPGTMGLADFDNDGLVELYVRTQIYDAHSGALMGSFNVDDDETNAPHQGVNRSWGMTSNGPVAVDMIDTDPGLELIAGCRIYGVTINRGAMTANITLTQERPEYATRTAANKGSATSVADFNQDGFLDILAVGSLNAYDATTTIFFWDLHNGGANGTLKTYTDITGTGDYTNGWKNGAGRINIADIDGDTLMNAVYVSGNGLYALKEGPTALELLWKETVTEQTSGYTGCTMFDFNADGKSEIVYRDEDYIYIYTTTNTAGVVTVVKSPPVRCASRTSNEYPIVADMDGDGSTEICVTCAIDETVFGRNHVLYDDAEVRVYESANVPWVPARRVWNQHGYFVVNVNDNLTIPRFQQLHHLAYAEFAKCRKNGTSRPLNSFLNQSPFLNSEGCPSYATPNLAFAPFSGAVDISVNQPTCPSRDFTVSFKFRNKGDIGLSGNLPVSFYDGDPNAVGATRLNTRLINLNNMLPGDTVTQVNMTVNGPGDAFTLYIVLNDDGSTVPTPIALPNSGIVECDYSDNVLSVAVAPLPAAITPVLVRDNLQCLAVLPGVPTPADNGAVKAFVPIGAVNDSINFNFYWSDGATAKPIPADHLGHVYSGIPDGTYTVYAVHKTLGCGSDTADIVVGRVEPAIDVVAHVDHIYDNCKNPNGKLQAVVNDTDGDGVGDPVGKYTYTWYAGPLVLVGDTLGVSHTQLGLSPGTYTVLVVDKITGCIGNDSEDILDDSVQPEVDTTHVDILCSNLNSGSATATLVGGGTSGHKFYWYNGNAVKPTEDFEGSVYSNLGAGTYTVVAENNNTQCLSDPLTVRVKQTTDPVVSITAKTNQVSCDPARLSGSASAAVNGVTTGFTFEWFNGQNTNPPVITTGPTITGRAAGIYTVRARDNASGCMATDTVHILNRVQTATLTLTPTPMTRCQPFNGAVQATPSVGLPGDYKYTWYNGQTVKAVTDYPNDTTRLLANLGEGYFTVKAFNTKTFCETPSNFAQVLNLTPSITTTVIPNPAKYPTDCSAFNGVISARITIAGGNTNGFTVDWYKSRPAPPIGLDTLKKSSILSGSPRTDILFNVGTGYYTIVVKNQDDNCQDSEVYFLPSITSDSIRIVATDNTNCQPVNGVITADLLINPLNIPLGVTKNSYVLELYNRNSTTPERTIAGSANATNTFSFTALDSGIYFVRARPALPASSLCEVFSALDTIRHIPVMPTLALDSVANTHCDVVVPDGQVIATATGPAALSYEFFTGNNNTTLADRVQSGASNTLINRAGGFYTTQVTAGNGCSVSTSIYVPTDSAIVTVDISTSPRTMCDPDLDGAIQLNNVTEITSAGAANIPFSIPAYNVVWYDSTGTNTLTDINPPANILEDLKQNDYFVEVSNATTGCKTSKILSVIEDNRIYPVIDLRSFTNPTACLKGAVGANIDPTTGQRLGHLTIHPTGDSTLGFTVNWFIGIPKTPVPPGQHVPVPINLDSLIAITADTYSVEVVSNSNNCLAADSYVVPLDNIPVILNASTAPLTHCVSPNGQMSAIITSAGTAYTGYYYNWYIGETVQATPDFTGRFITTATNETYLIVATDQLDPSCEVRDTVVVEDGRIYPVVTAGVLNPLTMCDETRPDGVAFASVGGNVIDYAFDWYGETITPPPFITSPQINNLTDSTYTVIGRDLVSQCPDTAQVVIQFMPGQIPMPTIEILSQVTNCDLNNPNGELAVSVDGNTTSYIFDWYDGLAKKLNPDFSGVVYDSLQAGDYSVIAIDRFTLCESPLVSENLIFDPKYPTFVIEVAPTLCDLNTGSVYLTVTNDVEISSVEWYLEGTLVATGPMVVNADNGLYTVIIRTAQGCEATGTTEVKNEINPFNGISRNSDNLNDYFHINCIEDFPSNSVKIYNRVGTLVYESRGYDNNSVLFDGISNKGIRPMGDDLPDGTYFYVIDKRDGSKPLAGYLEIVN